MQIRFLVYLAAAAAYQGSVHGQSDCNYPTIAGPEFQFREADESLRKYGYQMWKTTPSTTGSRLGYESYAGKKGKLQSEKVEVGRPPIAPNTWHVAILETCEKAYAWANVYKDADALERTTGIYFFDTLRRAQSMVGSSLWISQTGAAKELTLFIVDPKVRHQVAHLEQVTITGVHVVALPHGSASAPFNLIVKKQSGDEGLLPFNSRYFFTSNPIDPTWPADFAETIKQRKIRLGMSAQQVELSWGKPERVNSTVSAQGVREQWVYGGGQLLYLEDGKLTTFQSSR